MLPTGREHLPYEGAKPVLRVEEVDDSAFLTALMETLYQALPAAKAKKVKLSSLP